ncbi:MAG: hypothetical protein HZB26_11655 [Candidatus Hydrogenedentes bacterium]|nr:hypothetical protein [Candidatus Hydrogenedentota bacterium]
MVVELPQTTVLLLRFFAGAVAVLFGVCTIEGLWSCVDLSAHASTEPRFWVNLASLPVVFLLGWGGIVFVLFHARRNGWFAVRFAVSETVISRTLPDGTSTEGSWMDLERVSRAGRILHFRDGAKIALEISMAVPLSDSKLKAILAFSGREEELTRVLTAPIRKNVMTTRKAIVLALNAVLLTVYICRPALPKLVTMSRSTEVFVAAALGLALLVGMCLAAWVLYEGPLADYEVMPLESSSNRSQDNCGQT